MGVHNASTKALHLVLEYNRGRSSLRHRFYGVIPPIQKIFKLSELRRNFKMYGCFEGFPRHMTQYPLKKRYQRKNKIKSRERTSAAPKEYPYISLIHPLPYMSPVMLVAQCSRSFRTSSVFESQSGANLRKSSMCIKINPPTLSHRSGCFVCSLASSLSHPIRYLHVTMHV
jgi:hypothetical protein